MNSHKRFSALLTALLALTVMLGGIAFAQDSTKNHKNATTSQSGAKVDLNTASESELNSLPGIGPATSKKIIAGRPYSSVDDLKNAGLSAKQIDKIRDLTVASAGAAATKPSAGTESQSSTRKSKASEATPPSATGEKVDLNSASERDLNNLPGVGPATSKKIIAGRPYSSVDDLKHAGLTAKQIEKIRDLATASGGVSAKAAANTPAPTQPTPPATASKGQMRPEERQSTASAGMPQKDTANVTPPPAGSGQVWVNLDTKVYHREGDRWYGKTKHGKYMSAAEAEAAGYRAAKK
jgi:DNA uptake protein ComE-like DNA-binding protein